MIRWADPDAIERAVRAYADDVRRRHPEVRAIHWYGSWTSGRATPSSDVDLCIIVTEDDRPPRSRVADYLPDRFPVPVDLAVVTEEEWRRLPERAPGWHRAIVSGSVLFAAAAGRT